MQIETVSLLEVIAAARARQASLVPESAGYVMLALGRAMAGVPMALDLDHILLNTEGQVTISGSKEAVANKVAVAALRKLMTELLDLSNGFVPGLRQLADREGPSISVDTFFAAIAKALIPINRAAAKRALARLARETVKAYQAGTLERPSLVLDAARLSALSRVSMPTAPREPTKAATEASPHRASPASSTGPESVERDPLTPSPADARASLTPTFVDTDVSVEHERMSFREEVMRAVVGYVAKDAGSHSPEAPARAASVTPEGSAIERRGPTEQAAPKLDAEAAKVDGVAPCTALDLLDRTRTKETDGAKAKRSAAEPHAAGDARPRKAKRLSRRPEKVVARLDDLAPPYSATSVESLLERFEVKSERDDSLQLVASSLGELGSMHMTPLASSVGAEDASPEPTGASEPSGRVAIAAEAPVPTPSTSVDVDLSPSPEESRASATPAGQSFDRAVSSLPPLFVDRIRPRPRRWALGAFAATAVLGLLGASALWRTEALGRKVDAAASPVCRAELTLKNLPDNHEVLVRLGTAPFTTRSLPRGVRLELVVTAPDHKPARLVVERDALWSQAGLELEAKLEPGAMAGWPAAPPGEVGGVGPAGELRVVSTAPASEVWLVAAAGASAHAHLSLPCEETAHVLVVDPTDALHAKRVELEPELLRAAAKNGEGEVAVLP